MTQSPRTSLLDAATQAAVGLPLGFVVVYAVSWLRLSPAATAVLTTGLMFVVSTARGYVVRRRFDRRAGAASYSETREQWRDEHIPHGSL